MMTRKMIMALSAAAACINHRGLQRTSSGFVSTDSSLAPETYSFSTIRALRDRGLVDAWGGGEGRPMVVHITERGERALAEWSEKLAQRKCA